MDSEIGNIEAAESERLLSGNVVKPHIYGSKEPGPETAIMADNNARNSNPSETKTQYIAALAATGGALAAGAALAWSSPTEDALTKKGNEYGFPITKDDFAWVGSLVTLGAASVCLVIGTVLQLLGRKLTMLLLVFPFTVGWLLVIFASNLAMLMVGRFLLGVAGGAFCVAAPTYTGEIAQSSIRGTLGSYFQLMMVIGILLVYCIGLKIDKGVTVFALNVISAAIPLIFGAIFVFMPESPTYLVAKGRKDEAAKSLRWLRGSNYDISQELAELQAQQEEDQKNRISFFAALGRRATQKALFISLGLMFFQQMSGVNAVIFFTSGIFKSTGAGIDPAVATLIVGVMQVISVFVSSIIVDKAGRRLLLLPSALAMAITTALLGTYFFMKNKNPDSVTSLGWLPIASLCGFIILFSIGFGPIPWMMMGELFSNDVKGVAGSIAGAFNWALAFLITSTFGKMKEALGEGQTFWLFTAFCVLGLLFVFFFVPETKGKSLAEIQQILAGEKVMDTDNATKRTTSDSKF